MPLWPVQGQLCLQAMNFNVSVAYRLPARSSLEVSKEMEITGPHAASWTCDWLRWSSCEVMDLPSYRPDLAPRLFHLTGPLRSTWLENIWQREASCHLLGTRTWHSLLLRQNTNLGVTVGQMGSCQCLCEFANTVCYQYVRYTLKSDVYHLLPMFQVHTEVWCVSSATNVSGTHWSLMCIICYQYFRYTLKSDAYRLLPEFQVHTEVWCVPSATNVSDTHLSLMCTNCHQYFRYTLKSDAYHLLPEFQVHTEVRTQLSASECLTYFLKLFCLLASEYYRSSSHVLKQRLKISP